MAMFETKHTIQLLDWSQTGCRCGITSSTASPRFYDALHIGVTELQTISVAHLRVHILFSSHAPSPQRRNLPRTVVGGMITMSVLLPASMWLAQERQQQENRASSKEKTKKHFKSESSGVPAGFLKGSIFHPRGVPSGPGTDSKHGFVGVVDAGPCNRISLTQQRGGQDHDQCMRTPPTLHFGPNCNAKLVTWGGIRAKRHVRFPAMGTHCVFVSSTEEMWCRKLSALRWCLEETWLIVQCRVHARHASF